MMNTERLKATVDEMAAHLRTVKTNLISISAASHISYVFPLTVEMQLELTALFNGVCKLRVEIAEMEKEEGKTAAALADPAQGELGLRVDVQKLRANDREGGE